MRLAALGMSHEANTFAPGRVSLATFEADGILRGDEIVARHAAADTTMAGLLSAGELDGVDVVPLLFTTVTPAGAITADAIEALAGEMTALLRAERFDGVLLALHGAAVAETRRDADGYLLSRVREAVGAGVPVGVSLDLHANVSEQMVACADVLNTYRTNPHVDARERGREAAELVVRTVRGEVAPRVALEQVPVVVDILSQNTGQYPMRQLLTELDATLREPGVLSASVTEGYPYADVPEMGMATVVVTDGDGAAARRHARRLGECVWQLRDAYRAEATGVDDALTAAATADRTPTLLLDVGDNVGGGAAGDSVVLLAAARRLGVAGVLAIVDDAAAAAECARAGVGAKVELTVGGRSDQAVGPPLPVEATVRRLHEGTYWDDGPTHSGLSHFDMGSTAVVDTSCGQTLVLTSRAVMPVSAEQLRCLDLDPRAFRAVVAKGVQSPLAAYGPVAADVVQVDTPGVTSADLDRFDYRHRRRPLYPFEPHATYPPSV